MKAVFFLLILVLTSIAEPRHPGFCRTDGKQILDMNGQGILLRGINLGNWLLPEGYMFKMGEVNCERWIKEVLNQAVGTQAASEFWEKYRNSYITEEDIKFIKSTGLNSIRVPFNYRCLVVEEHPDLYLTYGFEMLDRIIKWCSNSGLYVILDMHAAPGGQTGDNIDDSYGYPFLFLEEKNQELTVKLWKKIADRYKDEKFVMGYDLLNEPIAHYFKDDSLNDKLEPLYRRVTAAIREVDQNHIIFLGGAQWNTNFSVFSKPFDNNVVYTFHKYWMDPVQEAVQEYVEFSNKYNVPIWLGESGENTDDWISKFRVLLEKNSFGWCFWPYKKLDATSCMVSINTTPEYDKLIEFVKADRASFKKIRENKPQRDIVIKALNDYLENCRFSKCNINEGYLRALGLR